MIEINSIEEFIKYATAFNYRYAKTYTDFAPHEYAVAQDNTKEIEIIRALNKYIQDNGEEEIFYKKEYQVLFAGNHKYWSVGPWDETRFLNRNWDYKLQNGHISRTITESKKGS